MMMVSDRGSGINVRSSRELWELGSVLALRRGGTCLSIIIPVWGTPQPADPLDRYNYAVCLVRLFFLSRY